MAPTHRRGPWVSEEDQLLLQLVREQGPNNWVRISQHMHYRSPKQCRERFHQNLKPSLNREPISAEEGLMIERMVNEMGKRWAEIARRLGNRSDNAVKNWWNGSMNRKRRGLNSHSSRTFNGRVETPYPRASMNTQPSWTKSPKIHVESSPSSIYSPGERRVSVATSVDCHRQLAPIFTLPSINRPVETPLTSPAFSEVSNAPSIEPPSMVSDHNSVSSASPRTLPSPQLLPIPADLRLSHGEMRRPSVLSLHSSEDGYFPNQGGKTLESLSELALRSRYMPDLQSPSWHQHSASLSRGWPSPPEETRPESLKTSSRDSRMGLHSLLN